MFNYYYQGNLAQFFIGGWGLNPSSLAGAAIGVQNGGKRFQFEAALTFTLILTLILLP